MAYTALPSFHAIIRSTSRTNSSFFHVSADLQEYVMRDRKPWRAAWLVKNRVEMHFFLALSLAEPDRKEETKAHLRELIARDHQLLRSYLDERGVDGRQTLFLVPNNFYRHDEMGYRFISIALSLLPFLFKDLLPEQQQFSWKAFFDTLATTRFSFDSLVNMAIHIARDLTLKNLHVDHIHSCVIDFFIDPNELRASHDYYLQPDGTKFVYDEARGCLDFIVEHHMSVETSCFCAPPIQRMADSLMDALTELQHRHGPRADAAKFRIIDRITVDTAHYTLCEEGIIYETREWPLFIMPEYVQSFVLTFIGQLRTLLSKEK